MIYGLILVGIPWVIITAMTLNFLPDIVQSDDPLEWFLVPDPPDDPPSFAGLLWFIHWFLTWTLLGAIAGLSTVRPWMWVYASLSFFLYLFFKLMIYPVIKVLKEIRNGRH